MRSQNLHSEAASHLPLRGYWLEEGHAPLNKRHKPSSPSQQQWNASNDASFGSTSRLNILDEPFPLGLRLRKSPSLLEFIQTKLSQGSMSDANTNNKNPNSGVRKRGPGAAAASGSVERLKASNFPATLLRIGSWEFKPRYEGDLVAKFYFAKQKLVWEILEGELKSKIEIEWSDVMALKANCPDNGPSSLTVALARQPLFFRETNPQPRKHTLWQQTSDFTNGQASKHRQHFLQCPQGRLTKHFEKLIQCDKRLNFLSQRSEIILDSLYFDTQPAAFENHPDNLKDQDLHQVNGEGSAMSCFQDMGSSYSSLSPSFKIEHNDPPGITLDSLPRATPSPSSDVMDCRAIEGSLSSKTDSQGTRNCAQIELPGIHPSMSMSDFIGQIEHFLSEEMTPWNQSFSDGRLENPENMEDIAQYLLNDNQVTAASDEKSLMSGVNSLCWDPAALQNSHCDASAVEGPDGGKNIQLSHDLESMLDNKIETDVKAAEEDFWRQVGTRHVQERLSWRVSS